MRSSINELNREFMGYFCCLDHRSKLAVIRIKLNFLLYNYVIKTHSHCKEYRHVPFP